MEILLNWDMVLFSAFVVLMAYNFILGQNATIKLLLSIYIAIMTADGVAIAIRKYLVDPSPGWQDLLGAHEDTFFITLRLGLFLLSIVLFVVKGGFQIAVEEHEHWAARMGLHGIFAALAALLFLSTVLIYVSGSSFVEGMLYAPDLSIYQESSMVRLLVDYYQLWFSLPGMCFLVASFVLNRE
ncbi:hypothetical protein H6771_00110 [Candidatus Peribacteria bacterium]|nr:hypothetical protein [Candidatus Peribacteria bacterium]